jgi:hypothetical protein
MSDTYQPREPEMAADYDLQTHAFDAPGEKHDGARDEELPARPRRRPLTPLTIALLVALTTACGFIAGVKVQKGQGPSSSSAGPPSGVAAQPGALRSRGSGGVSGFSLAGGAGGFPGAGAGAGGSGGFTAGEVAYLRGSTLYVTNSQGNTVRVAASGSRVSKTVSTRLSSIRPGDTVLVTGSQTKSGGIEASSISISSSGSGAASGVSGSGGASGAPALFGSG